jgi:hypothetical protein
LTLRSYREDTNAFKNLQSRKKVGEFPIDIGKLVSNNSGIGGIQ